MAIIGGNMEKPVRWPWWAAAAATLAVSALYLSLFVDRGWIPQDEGALGQQAVRWLAGELPHRDYHEIYTGGLTVLNGLAFRLLGESTLSLRYMLLAAALATLLAVFLTLKNVLSARAAALATLLILVWSFPNYFAGLSSWYVLAFWCVGVCCVVRHDRGGPDEGAGSAGWLVAAGACAGLSMLMKIPGLFFIPAAVLHLCRRALREPRDGTDGRAPDPLGTGLIAAAIGFHAAGVLCLFKLLPQAGVFLNLVLPSLAVDLYAVGLLVKGARPSRADTRALAARLLAFFAGVFLALLPVVLLYWRAGALGDLATGVLVRPFGRTARAWPFPPLPYSLFGLGLSLLVAAGLWGSRWKAWDRRAAWVLAVAFTGLLAMSGAVPVYKGIFNAVRTAPPFLSVVTAAFLWTKRDSESALRHAPAFTALVFMALCGLIQFPFAHPIYFCYMSPFLWMLLAVLAGTEALPWPRSVMVACLFFLLFAALTMNTASVYVLGKTPDDSERRPLARLGLSRSPLRVPAGTKAVWQPLVERVMALTGEGEAVFAGPDCPEVYFLSGRRNPTKILYEFFEEPEGLEEGILADIDRNRCRVAVINGRPEYSAMYSRRFCDALNRRFKNFEVYGPFVLLYNSGGPPGRVEPRDHGLNE
jgi:hypothetical protein